MAETRVEYCGCVAPGLIKAKSGVAKQEDKPATEVPWLNRQNGIAFQDATYGKGNRVHNITSPRRKERNVATCTICGRKKAL